MTLVDWRNVEVSGLGESVSPADRARAGVSALFEEQYTRMLRVAAVLLGEVASAEEAVQDAFMALYLSWHRIEQPDATGYLHRSVVNAARSRLRRRTVAERVRPLTSQRHVQSAEDIAVSRLVGGALVGALRALAPREREVVLCRYYLDLSEQQTAEALGLSRGSVKAYASRGLAALRATLPKPSETEERRP